MRVNPMGNEPSRSVKNKKKVKGSHGRYSKVENKGFADFLIEEEEKDLNALMDEIVQSGNDFSRSPTEENFENYKKKVKEFLKLIEKRLYRTNELTSIEERRAKLYFIVEAVDKELEEISKRLFEAERSTLFYASKIGKINGLLMDIYR
ncbi:YaaR family protein [Mesoaciditoga sp.]